MEGPELIYMSKKTIFEFSRQYPGEALLAVFEEPAEEGVSLGLATYQEARQLLLGVLQDESAIDKIERLLHHIEARKEHSLIVVYLHIERSEEEFNLKYGVSSFLRDGASPEPGDRTKYGFLSKGGDA